MRREQAIPTQSQRMKQVMPDILTRLKAIASTKYKIVILTYGIPIKTAITVLRTELLRSGVNYTLEPTANTV